MLRHLAIGRAKLRLGFTLIELLVVVAIIALLISILLPSLRAAREQAKQLLCVTNMRSMGSAAVFYAHDWNDFIVRAEEDDMHFLASLFAGLGFSDVRIYDENRDGNNNDSIWNWSSQRQVRRYIRTLRQIEILQCPSFPEPEQPMDYVVNGYAFPYFRQPGDRNQEPPDDTSPSADQAPSVRFSKLNDLGSTVVGQRRGDDGQFVRANVSAYDRQPATKIYITEGNAKLALPNDPSGAWGQFHDLFVFRHLPFAQAPRISNDRRHPGGITALFFDGHAETVPWKELDPGFPRRFDDRLRKFTAFRGRRR